MAKTNIPAWDTTAANNTDVNSISTAENVMTPGTVNNAFREIMAEVASYTRRGADTATAATLNLDTTPNEFLDLTGTVTVTAVTLTDKHNRRARAQGAFQLTASASLIVNGSTSTNYTTTAGDLLFFEGYSSSVVRVWVTSGGAGLQLASQTEAATLTDTAKAVTSNDLTFLGGYTTTATAAGTTTLTVTSNYNQYFTGTTTQTLVLPVTSTLVLGRSYRVVNNSTGSVTVQSSGANTILIMPAGTSAIFTCILTSGTTAASWDYRPSPVSATSQASTSGTTIDFTGIPSWAKRVTCTFVGVTINATTDLALQIGDSGGIETTGYLGAGSFLTSTPTAGVVQGTTLFNLTGGGVSSSAVVHGAITLTLADASTNTWTSHGVLTRSDTGLAMMSSGSKTLSPGPLDRVRFTTSNGTATFTAGKVNVLWE